MSFIPLGVLASQKIPELAAYESIATVLVGSGGSATVSFTSIPSTYKHLQIRTISRGTTAASVYTMKMNFNSNTSGQYMRHALYGDGSAAAAAASATSTTYIGTGEFPAASASASRFGANVIDILDYTNTNKNTTARILAGYDVNGSGIVALWSGLWANTSAITQIDLTPSAGNFAEFSSFALYGIKG